MNLSLPLETRARYQMHKLSIVTTSWDDGNHADLKVADLLRSRGMGGTFYIPIHYEERTLQNSDLKDLAGEGFEIGAHGFSHKLLWGLSAKELAEEIRPCKPTLEDIIAKEVPVFCYPCGRYDENVVRILRECGYQGARTTRMLATGLRFDPFEIPTTVQSFPHLPFTYWKNVARGRSFANIQTCVLQISRLGNWVDLGKRLFDSVLEKGGIWHLYGHSWEIERQRLWQDLSDLLSYVSGKEDVSYLPNGGLVREKMTEQ